MLLCGDRLVTGVVTNEDDIKHVLDCTEEQWEEVKCQARSEGTLHPITYLGCKNEHTMSNFHYVFVLGKVSLKHCPQLQKLCDKVTQVAGYCSMKGRMINNRGVTLFCVKAGRPSTLQLNSIYEQLLNKG